MIVVADTSVLINLCCIRRHDLLRKLFHEVLIPTAVAEEFVSLSRRRANFANLALPDWVQVRSATSIPREVQAFLHLDAGETSALALALEIHADAILLDERLGHQAAVGLGLVVIGLLGVLIRAKQIGALPAVAPELEALRRDAGFWISAPVRLRVLQLAGESD